MSWPADGKPRFKLVVTRGRFTPSTGQGRPHAASFAILDRAFCHRTIKVWRTDRTGNRLPYSAIEDQAHAMLVELNGKEPRP